MRGVVRYLLLFSTLSAPLSLWSIVQAEESGTYDQYFQEGLKAEANQKWADAVQFYALAMAKNPKSPWPKERLKSLFTNLQKAEQPIESYKLLLPNDLLDEFMKTGVIQEHYDAESAVNRLNTFIWAGVLALLATIGGLLLYFSLKSKAREDDVEIRRDRSDKKKAMNRQFQQHTNAQAEAGTPKASSPAAPKKDLKLSEQARANITGVVTNVKSLNFDLEKNKEITGAQKVDVEALQDSGVIEAFVKDWVTEVAVEQTDTGKFSKMTVDAVLLFDEDKVQENSGKKS